MSHRSQGGGPRGTHGHHAAWQHELPFPSAPPFEPRRQFRSILFAHAMSARSSAIDGTPGRGQSDARTRPTVSAAGKASGQSTLIDDRAAHGRDSAISPMMTRSKTRSAAQGRSMREADVTSLPVPAAERELPAIPDETNNTLHGRKNAGEGTLGAGRTMTLTGDLYANAHSNDDAGVIGRTIPITTTQSPNSAVNTATTYNKHPDQAMRTSGQKNVAMQEPGCNADRKAFWKKIQERVVFSLLMIAGFMFILVMGPSYMILLVLVLETLVYREVTALFNVPGHTILSQQVQNEVEDDDEGESQRERQAEELWSKSLSWYFFAVCNFFLYGETLVYYFKHVVMTDSLFLHFARHHRFISFMLYMFGFMAFVSNLKRRNLKHQFALFCWVHMSLMLIVLSSHFLVDNILEGIIWFWVPSSLVICNDVFAYVCGMMFGRTPLISLSPKKTVEGFIGALLITLAFSWFWAGFFQQFDYMVCPAMSLGMSMFNPPDCEVNSVFLVRTTALPSWIADILSHLVGRSITTFSWTPFQCHALVMAAFASLVAPFGGFFASGFKRAFKIKDFGHSIPGHGGLTDRFDCQFLMGLFSYVYYSSLIRDSRMSVQLVMQIITTQLPIADQKQLLQHLSSYLVDQGQL